MTIYIKGGDARACVFTWKNSEKREADRIYCVPGNPGTKAFSDEVPAGFSPKDADLVIQEPYTIWESAENRCADIHGFTEISAMSDGENMRFFPTVESLEDGKMILTDAFTYPSDEKTDVFSDFLKNTVYKGRRGFYTMRFPEGSENPCAFLSGLSFASACALLPLVKGDFIRLASAVDSGIDDSFEIAYRDEYVCVLANEGESGKKIFGLDDLQGDTGVFINSAVIEDDRLVSSGTRPLYVCIRDKKKCPALERAQDEINRITLL